MTTSASFSQAQGHLAELWDRVVDDRETIVLKRPGKQDVALIAADELRGLIETAPLLRSPHNAERLLAALARAQAETEPPASIDSPRRELRLDATR
jgi:antitoxin YefM